MKKLTSDDYRNLATIIASRAHAITKERSMVPPLKIHATGADDDTIVDSLYDDEGVHPIGVRDQPLTARYPVTVTITDQTGDQVEITIDEDLTVQ